VGCTKRVPAQNLSRGRLRTRSPFLGGRSFQGMSITDRDIITVRPRPITFLVTLQLISHWASPSENSASVNALNVTNSHLLIANSNTFGGFHFNNPRQAYGEVRYRFHH